MELNLDDEMDTWIIQLLIAPNLSSAGLGATG